MKSGITDTKQPYFKVNKDEQQKLIESIAAALEEAHSIGVGYGQALVGKQERRDKKKDKNFLSMAYAIVVGIVDRVRETISDALSKHKEAKPEEPSSPEQVVQDVVASEIDILPDLVAETEIVGAVESVVLDTLKEADVPQIVWVTNPGACEVCTENEEQGPIDLGKVFASGNAFPPAHPRCRCNLSIP